VEDNLLGVLPLAGGSGSNPLTKVAGNPKFLFLRNIIPSKTVLEIYSALRRLRFHKRNHSRGSVGNGRGGDTSLGWFDKPVPRRLVATSQYPMLYCFYLLPLLNAVSGVMREYLPDYWREQAVVARRNRNMVIGSEYRDMHPPVFSTVTVNRNVIFRCHADGKNNSALACLMTFGHFSGGYLCLPRLRVAFNLRPGDVLLADNNEEQHGNIGPLVGERISLVAYLRDLSKGAAPRPILGPSYSIDGE
jgi:hypothetical protein